MGVKSNTRLGSYEVLSLLGAGGMGEVYRARDSRLDRDVAIKVLPEALARDKERILRFEREAKVLASLNHPNIGAIFGFEAVGARKFLVLEFVEGQPLAARLKSGAMPLDEVLNTARQIAEALEAAHEKGIVHRDLKPGNVMIRSDGVAKVLDFGLARAMVDEPPGDRYIPDSPTETSPAPVASPTNPGVILGTAGYMSPEQARGKPVDKRSDIFSFGCVLYEMLTGAQPFFGETVTDSIGAVLHRDPDWALLPTGTPSATRLLLRRCLAKDRAKRLRDIGDARIEIEYTITAPTSNSTILSPSDADRQHTRQRSRWFTTVLVVFIMLLVSYIGYSTGRKATPPSTPQVRKFEIPLAHSGTWGLGQPAVSPDGTMVAFVDQGKIWTRRLDSFDVREVPDSEQAIIPFWSPDNRWLGFAKGDSLFRIPVAGGRASVIAKGPKLFSPVGGAVWTRDGLIFFSTGDTGILEVPASGGEPRVVVATDGEDDDDFHELALLPGERNIVFCVHSRTRPWYLASWDGKERRVVIQLDQHIRAPVYSPSGQILFEQFGNDIGVWALPFSIDRMAANGDPFLVSGGDGDPSVSDTGVLALARRVSGLEGGELVSLNLSTDKVDSILKVGGVLYDPVLSPDETTVALAGFSPGAADLWLMDVRQGTRTRLTFDENTNEVLPRWSPDGKMIAFAKTKASTFERISPSDTIQFFYADGSGETREPVPGGSPSFDREWNYLAFVRNNGETGRDIYYATLGDTPEAHPLLQSPSAEQFPALSPDGQWLAFTSNESGEENVFITRFPSAHGKWQVSTSHGDRAQWSADGSRLYYVDGSASIREVQITFEPRVMLSQPRLVVDGFALGINPYQGFALSGDGQRLYAVRTGSTGGMAAIGIVENWFEEFRKR